MLQYAGPADDGAVHRFIGAAAGEAPTFYPGTASASDAQRLPVTAGQTTSAGDLRMLHVPLAQISGTVVDSRGLPATGMVVMLHPARMDGALLPLQANLIQTDAEGRFVLPNVSPGDYRLDVESGARLEAIGQTGSTQPPAGREFGEFASEALSVRSSLRDVVVRTSRGFRVSGRILTNGDALRSEQLPLLRLDLLPILPGQGVSGVLQARDAAVAADGTFTASGVSGRRMIRISGLPATHVLQAVHVHGADVADSGVEILDNVTGVEIVVTSRPATVRGIVTDVAGVQTKEFAVAIFPVDSRRWSLLHNRYLAAVHPDPAGSFSRRGLPSGEYYAVAVDALGDGEWAEPERLAELRAPATRFTLADGETRTLTLVRR